jgi:hypothetical protein
VIDYAGVIFWVGSTTQEVGPFNVRLQSKFIRFTERVPETQWGLPEFIYGTREIYPIDPYENNPPPLKSGQYNIANYDKEVRIPGTLMYVSDPYLNTVALAGPAVTPAGSTQTLYGRPMVAYAIRSVPMTGIPSFLTDPIYPVVRNHAFAVRAEGLAPPAVQPGPYIFSDLQWLEFFDSQTLPPVTGASLVAFAIRSLLIQQPLESSLLVGIPRVGLFEQFIEPPSVTPGPPPAFFVKSFFNRVEPWPIPAVSSRGDTELGAPVVFNQDRTIAMYPAFYGQFIQGYPTVDLFTRELEFEGASTYGAMANWKVEHADRTLKLPSVYVFAAQGRWSVRNELPDPPGDQRITMPTCEGTYAWSCSETVFGTGWSIRKMSIDFGDGSDWLPSGKFGALEVFFHTIGIIQSWHHTGFGIPRTDDGEQTIAISQLVPHLLVGKPSFSPQYVFMYRDAHETAVYENQTVKEGQWSPLDETGPDDGYTIGWRKGGFGHPIKVSNEFRWLYMSGKDMQFSCGPYRTASCVGEPVVYNKTLHITSIGGVSSLGRGRLTIFPHTIRVYAPSIYYFERDGSPNQTPPSTQPTTVYGEFTVEQDQMPELPWDRTLTFQGFDSFTPGALDPQNWIREVYPTGWVVTVPVVAGHPNYPPQTKVWGNNTPMVYHYPRRFTVSPSGESTLFGLTWVSNAIRYLELESEVEWEDIYFAGMTPDYSGGMMRVSREGDTNDPGELPPGGGGTTPSNEPIDMLGPLTQVIGSPAVALTDRRVTVYMIGPPCVIGMQSIDHA